VNIFFKNDMGNEKFSLNFMAKFVKMECPAAAPLPVAVSCS
jgi:hypothetical protein